MLIKLKEDVGQYLSWLKGKTGKTITGIINEMIRTQMECDGEYEGNKGD